MSSTQRPDQVRGGQPQIAVTRRDLPGSGIARLAQYGEILEWSLPTPPTYEQVAQLASAAEGLLCISADRIDDELLKGCPKLKVVSNVAVGYDNFDLEALTRRGIPAGNTPGVLSETVADLTWALMLGSARRLIEYVDFVRSNEWQARGSCPLLGIDLYGTTLGIVGVGSIGRLVARRAQGFRMRVLGYDPLPGPADNEFEIEMVDLSVLLHESDFVTLHVNLNPTTSKLVDAAFLGQMKPTAILINTSRGQVVDQSALYEALVNGGIRAAAIDVADPEPMAAADPLLTLPSVTALPHVGSATYVTRARMVDVAVDNVIAGLAGQRLPHCVNPGVYESSATGNS